MRQEQAAGITLAGAVREVGEELCDVIAGDKPGQASWGLSRPVAVPRIGAVAAEQFDDLTAALAIEDGDEQRGVPVVVDRINPGACIQQGPGRRDGSLLGGEVQSGEARLIGSIRISAAAEQEPDLLQMIIQGRIVQQYPAAGTGISHPASCPHPDLAPVHHNGPRQHQSATLAGHLGIHGNAGKRAGRMSCGAPCLCWTMFRQAKKKFA
jgi:hypothetical protein